MGISFGWGITFALCSLAFNGSFSSMNKLPRVVETRINAQIFNIYFSLGVVLSSIVCYIVLLAIGETVTFTYLGVLSGLLLAFAGIFTFAAIEKIGLSVGTSIWSGTAVLVSFLEGVLGDEPPEYWGYAILGVIILVIGIVGVAFSEATAQCLCFTKQEMQQIAANTQSLAQNDMAAAQHAAMLAVTQQISNQEHENSYRGSRGGSQLSQGTKSYHSTSNIAPADTNTNNLNDSNDLNNSANKTIPHSTANSNSANNTNLTLSTSTTYTHTTTHRTSIISDRSHYDEFNEEMDISRWFLGIFYAMLTGIFGGSVGFPETYTDSTNSGAKFLVSFAVGVAIIFPVTLLSQCFLSNDKIQWHAKAAMMPGVISGIVWNLGNLCSLYAIESLSYGVAYPIMQSSLVVGVIWGIFVWKEFSDKRVIATIFTFSVVVVVGCTIITIGVQG